MLEASLVPRLQDLALDRTEQVGYLGTKSILARHDPITAIFVGRLVLNRLAGPHGAPQQVMIPIDIVPRESCARPLLSRESPLSAKLDSNKNVVPDASMR